MNTKKLASNLTFILFSYVVSSGQNFPRLDETYRINQLQPPESGKVRMVLDTDTYNEVDDQFALSYAYLSKEKTDLEAVYAAPFLNRRSDSPADGMEKAIRRLKSYWA